MSNPRGNEWNRQSPTQRGNEWGRHGNEWGR